MRGVVEAAEQATASARDAALVPISQVVAAAPPGVGEWAALAGGALVEMGAAPGPLVEPVFTRLAETLQCAVSFMELWHRHVGEPLPEPQELDTEPELVGIEAATERLLPDVGEDAYSLAVAWWILDRWMSPAIAMLQHFGGVRERVPQREVLADLIGTLAADPAVGQMPHRRHMLYHLVELLVDEHRSDGHHQQTCQPVQDPLLAAHDQLTTARLLAERGDLTTAARHISDALLLVPDLPEAHEALAALASRAGTDALGLFPVEEGSAYLGNVVARAHLLAGVNAPDDALGLLLSATRYDARRPWARVPWIQDPDVARRLDPEGLTQRLMSFAVSLPNPVPEDDRPPLLPYLELARNAVAAHPDNGLLHGVAANLARRLGAEEEAVAWATRGEMLAPSEMTAMFSAIAHQSAGDVDAAVAAYQRMLGYNPHNTAAYTDLAELLGSVGRLDEALVWVERALAINPDDPAAFPSACALRCARDRSPVHLIPLVDYLRAHPDVQHAHTTLAKACAGHPWLSFVPGPAEAVTKILQVDYLDPEKGSRPAGMHLSVLESPSAMTTLARALPGIEVFIGDIPEPDIRLPRRPVGTQVWTYDGTVARSALPAPSDAGARAVAEFAAVATIQWPYPSALRDAAVHLGGLPLDDLLGVLTSPPEPPDTDLGRELSRMPEHWTRSVLAAACIGLLHHRPEEPWHTSTRRRLLVDLVFGIEDWTSETAAFALTVESWANPAARDDVAALIDDRLSDAADVLQHRPVTIAASLAQIALATPGLPAHLTELALKLGDE